MSGWQISGAVTGGLGLAAQISTDLSQMYAFYLRGQSIPEDYGYLVHMILSERYEFLAFCQAAGLCGETPKLAANLESQKDIIANIFEKIRDIYVKTQKYHAQYQRHLPKKPGNGHDQVFGPEIIDGLGLKTILGMNRQIDEPQFVDSSIDSQHTTSKWPNLKDRWTWASKDATQLQTLINRLREYNRILQSKLSDSQRRGQFEAVDAMSRGGMQLNTAHQNQQMHKALTAIGSTSPHKASTSSSFPSPAVAVSESSNFQLKQRQAREELLQIHIQIQYQEKLTAEAVVRAMKEIQPTSKRLLDDYIRPMTHRSFAKLGDDKVWIDWKDPGINTDEVEVHENRIKLLVQLLRNESIKIFRSPVCLGYVRRTMDHGQREHGIVFKLPNNDIELKDLRDLISQPMKPSIPPWPQRATLCAVLAQAIYNFHTIGWMHKSIRSENIVFMKEGPQIDWSEPYIVGFGLARPESVKGWTTQPLQRTKLQQLYRHPNAQKALADEHFRKSYDLYSLALVLIEIATWQPIEKFLDIDQVEALNAEQLAKFKGELQDKLKYYQKIVDAACGSNTFANVIYSCFAADKIDQPGEKSAAVVALEIQNMENVSVVMKLRGLSNLI